jgi:sulfur carrier protein
MTITFNGESREVPAGVTVAGLLEFLQLQSAAYAVELNREVLPRRQHAERQLRAGDRVEFVTLTGGG